MCTYLKNMAGWKPKDLKSKSFANIQELFDKAFKRVNTFIDFRTELVEGTEMEESSKKAEVMEETSKKAEIAQESSSKRVEDELEQENAKKQKVDDDQEAAKMKELMKIIPDEEEVAVDVIPLTTKPLSIVDWKIVKEGKISYYQIIRADRSSKRPEEGYEIVLWGDLKIMFEHHAEDALLLLVLLSAAVTPTTTSILTSVKSMKLPYSEEKVSFSVSNSEGLHKGYDRFQSLLSQLKIHGAGVSTEDANQKFLRVFESGIKGSTASSSSTQNCGEGSSSYTDELKYSFFANQSSGPQLDHEDLEQEELKALVTLNGDGVDWTGHAEDKEENFALMAHSNSGSNTEDDSQKALKNKGIVDSRCSKHMTRNKAYLAEYQDYNGGPVAFGGSKGVSTAFNISTASRPEVITATPITLRTTSVFKDEDIFLADALPLLKIDLKDKGKGVLEDRTCIVKVKSKDQDGLKKNRKSILWMKEPSYLQSILKIGRSSWLKKEQLQSGINLQQNLNRSLMMTYLKHTDFVSIGSEEDERLIQKMNKKVAGKHEEKVLEEPDSTKVEQEGNKESTKKRPGKRLKMKATKKSRMQKTDSNLEEEEHLKTFLKIVLDEEGIIDYEVLKKRFLIINWESKFYHLNRHGAECIYYRIFRSDESSRWIKTFSEMVTMFDRLDLEELYNLLMQRFESTNPEGVDLVLWGDLRIMFDANTEDELWQNQERWNLKSWNFYENCRVHTLTLEDGTEIHMLAERKYPLIKETLERMMSLKLIAESAGESAYNLLRFIQKQIDEYGSYDGSEKDL
ncbi:hypothetical protein Tco_0257261 [Tanacetum coccineum]